MKPLTVAMHTPVTFHIYGHNIAAIDERQGLHYSGPIDESAYDVVVKINKNGSIMVTKGSADIIVPPIMVYSDQPRQIIEIRKYQTS